MSLWRLSKCWEVSTLGYLLFSALVFQISPEHSLGRVWIFYHLVVQGAAWVKLSVNAHLLSNIFVWDKWILFDFYSNTELMWPSQTFSVIQLPPGGRGSCKNSTRIPGIQRRVWSLMACGLWVCVCVCVDGCVHLCVSKCMDHWPLIKRDNNHPRKTLDVSVPQSGLGHPW